MHDNINGKKYQSNVDIYNSSDPRVMVIDYISDGAIVLDVGCACGDLGVVLKEYRNATIYGLEYNQASVDIALKTGAYEDVKQFNLDNLSISDFSEYKNKFDYIVCGDVLEHLRNPLDVLNILKSYLKNEGAIIASIPNVAHMSIKSNLLLNDFTYTPVGLLDETHIHLFTYKSIAEGVSSIELKIDNCKFSMHNKNAWQPNDPYPFLSDEIKKELFTDWHSYVCQYVVKMSVVSEKFENIVTYNLSALNINELNAPNYIKEYRKHLLDEINSDKIIKFN